MKKIGIFILILLFGVLFISCKGEKETFYKVNFNASKGGYISGLEQQTIKNGESTEVVKAVPEEDYEFVSWSDGDTNDKKIIKNVNSDITLTASFKKIIYEYPTIFILTENYQKITSKEEYVSCIITVNDNKNPEYNINDATAKIRGRGNSTWGMPKKPYRIKFDEKVDLFGNGEAKNWTLIANYVDPTGGLRNYLAYTIGSNFDDLLYTTSAKFAEIYINGEYQGLYLVCEQIEADKNRVDIDDKIPSSFDTNNISFIVELDNKHDETDVLGLDYFMLGKQPYSIKAPKTDGKDFNEDVCAFIKDYLDFCLLLIRNYTFEELEEYIDVESFADGYIIHELFSSIDVNYTSWYMSKDKNGRLTNAPIWDFDISVGNVDYNDFARYPNTLFASNNTWYKYLLRHDEFKEIVKEKINKYYDMIHEMVDSTIQDVMKYQGYFDNNFEKWETIGVYVWPNPKEIVAITTWTGQINFMREWLFNKLDYMKKIYCE